MRDCIRQALSAYENPSIMKQLRENAMRADFGFERSAREYVRLYCDMVDSVECESV
jgi:glycogen synthase